MRQSACLIVNPLTVNNFAYLFNYTPVGRAYGSLMDQFELVGAGLSFICCFIIWVLPGGFLLVRHFSVLV